MNSSKLKIENFWIAILWVVVFMLILSWDQEKIVVLNLVLFCYFLRYLVGNSIESTLDQRREALLSSLLIDLNTQVSLLIRLIDESRVVLNNYHVLLLTLIKKTWINSNNMLLVNNAFSSFNFDFTFLQLSLQAACDETLTKQLEQNIFVSSQIILETTPLFTQDGVE